MQFLKSRAIKGTFILMAAGLLTRFIGFYYRIFLSARIGAEGMGLYQMIFPIYGLCFSLCVSGIHTAISRFASRKSTSSTETLSAGMLIAVPLSILCTVLLLMFGDTIAILYLHDERCGVLLRIIALSLPMAVIHACISGYFLGKRNAIIPGLSQLIEQLVRVLSVYIIFDYYTSQHMNLSITGLSIVAITGLIIGEVASSITCIIAFAFNERKGFLNFKLHSVKQMIKPIYNMAYPLTMTRVVLGIIHSIEASAVPYFLRIYGLSNSDALSIYGTLTAMAMPFILFPTTFTNALCQMLMPTIAEADSVNNNARIKSLSTRALYTSLCFGFLCTILFLLTGRFLGSHFFDSSLAGDFIVILAWLCPLTFTSSVMGSILNGLAQTRATFNHNLISSLLLLVFIIIAIPKVGMLGFLWGLITSEALCSILHTVYIFRYIDK